MRPVRRIVAALWMAGDFRYAPVAVHLATWRMATGMMPGGGTGMRLRVRTLAAGAGMLIRMRTPAIGTDM